MDMQPPLKAGHTRQLLIELRYCEWQLGCQTKQKIPQGHGKYLDDDVNPKST